MDFSSVFGVHEQALYVRTKQAELIANNIANADTPGYKAKDLDFREVLSSHLRGEQAGHLKKTNPRHMNHLMEPEALQGLQYRAPMQPSIDGNTVDVNIEKAAYMQNALRYEATYNFLNGRIKGILGALKGE